MNRGINCTCPWIPTKAHRGLYTNTHTHTIFNGWIWTTRYLITVSKLKRFMKIIKIGKYCTPFVNAFLHRAKCIYLRFRSFWKALWRGCPCSIGLAVGRRGWSRPLLDGHEFICTHMKREEPLAKTKIFVLSGFRYQDGGVFVCTWMLSLTRQGFILVSMATLQHARALPKRGYPGQSTWFSGTRKESNYVH